MADIVIPLDFAHLADDIAIHRRGAFGLVMQRHHHQAHRLAVATGDILLAALESVEAAVRLRAAGRNQVAVAVSGSLISASAAAMPPPENTACT